MQVSAQGMNWQQRCGTASLWIAYFCALCGRLPIETSTAHAANPESAIRDSQSAIASPSRGYRLLLDKPYLGADFTQPDFDNLWQFWPEPLRSQAAQATAAERRKMAFSRYGIVEAPGEERGPALGYVDDGRGGWVMNCLVCHAGKVAGQVIPGLGNSHLALQTLTQETLRARVRRGERLSKWDLSRLLSAMGASNGTTNAQVFSAHLLAMRDADLNLLADPPVPRTLNHDLDPPPLWNVRKKRRLYIDGSIEKSHRTIMQFVLLPRNSGQKIQSWENDFRDIFAWIESLTAPKYPWPIDHTLAEQGKRHFEQTCAVCHGKYGPDASYPEKTVDLGTLGTDSRRLVGIPRDHRERLQQGWLGEYGRREVVLDPKGYVAPPLDGIWASAPYLHNGSIPTLWHLLHPIERPAVWLRTEDGYDTSHVGLEMAVFDELPSSISDDAEKRRYFDTRLPGKSAAGHEFLDELDEEQLRAVLEYLKTL